MTKNNGDVIYFSNVEWSLFQRPQSLSLEFSRRGYRVFYIEPMLSIGSIVRHLIEFKSLSLPKLPYENVILLRPYLSLSTFRFGATRHIDKYSFKIWFSKIKKKYALRNDAIIFVNLPYWWKSIIDRNLFPNNKIVYDCIDDSRVHSRNTGMLEQMTKAEYTLAAEADLCFATASELYNKLKRLNVLTYMLPNAIDPEYFISNSNYIPADIKKLRRPILGFVGSLYGHIDFMAFEKIAQTLKEGTVALVGMTDRKKELEQLVDKYKNIVYLGAKQYTQVPAYINSFDICLCPLKIDEIGNSVNPLKLYEYFILGKPVISSRTKEMEKYSEYLNLYSNYDEIERVTQTALSESKDGAARQRRIKFAKENSWRIRVDRVEELLGLA